MSLRLLAFLVGVSSVVFSFFVSFISSYTDRFILITIGSSFILFGCIGKQHLIKLFNPLSNIGYFLIAIVFTIGCFILYKWPPEMPIIPYVFVLGTLVSLKEKTKPKNKIYKLNYLCVALLIVSLQFILSQGQYQAILGNWKFTGILWVLTISVLTSIYFDAKEMKKSTGLAVEKDSNS